MRNPSSQPSPSALAAAGTPETRQQTTSPRQRLSTSSSNSTATQALDNYTISHHAQMDRHSESMSRHADSSSSAASLPADIHTRQEARQVIVSSLVQILDQAMTMLRSGSVSDEQMATESQLIPGSSLGKHLRHVHDHYRILLDSIESQQQSSGSASPSALALDYDKRMRILPLETSAQAALHEFEQTQRRIERLLGDGDDSVAWLTDLDRPVQLNATTPAVVELGSTLGRELWFVCLHAIHHYALARVILVHELGLHIDDSFGVAPSTMVMRMWRQATQERSKL